MANLIQNNSKLIEQQKNQISQTDEITPNQKPQNEDVNRNPKTVRIIKDSSGFGFNVRGQISGKLYRRNFHNSKKNVLQVFKFFFINSTLNDTSIISDGLIRA